MPLEFLKMQGLGNDFVIVDRRAWDDPRFAGDQIRKIADRHFGVGCDQLIVMEASPHADVFMRIYNPDGSEAGACGNATRCVASIVMDEEKSKACVIETMAGLLACRLLDNGMIEADMGVARDVTDIEVDGKPAVTVNMGNPHCVFVVDDVGKVVLEVEGSRVEKHELFPARTNVEFIQILSPSDIRMRVWERGAGITLACGSGSCASIVAAVHLGLCERKAHVILDGGNLLLEWRESDNHVLMTGPVTMVFKGVIAI